MFIFAIDVNAGMDVGINIVNNVQWLVKSECQCLQSIAMFE